MLGMEQLNHAQVYFATVTEGLFKQSFLTEIHNYPHGSRLKSYVSSNKTFIDT